MEKVTKHWQIVLIVLLATWLRVWHLDTNGLLFGDAGHDILSAISAVETKQLPLLGIESSVPRFKQGPVTVWIHMGIHLLVNRDLYWHWLVFALIGTAAVIGVYEFGQLYVSNKVSLLASVLVATSPLAIAHSRMAYHITPIPLMTVLFLAATTRLAQKKTGALFWAVLAWAGLFQFELAVTPLFLVILYFLYQQKRLLQKDTFVQIGKGIFIGLLPQIIFDLTHRFTHLGGFLLWVGYRVVSLAPTGSHSFSLSTIVQVGNLFTTYWGRVISFDQPILSVIYLSLVALTLYHSLHSYRQKKLSAGITTVLASFLVLSIGYLLHGSPSEAYFPPFIVLLPLIAAFGICELPTYSQKILTGLMIGLAVFNTAQVVHHHFFMDVSNPFSYGYGVGEQRQIIAYATQKFGNGYYFETTHPAGSFANYFDNLRLLAWENKSIENTVTGQPLFIETKESSLNTYPNAVKVSFPSVDLYYLR